MSAKTEGSRHPSLGIKHWQFLDNGLYLLASAILPGALFGCLLIAKSNALLSYWLSLDRPTDMATGAAVALTVGYRLLVVAFFGIAVALFIVRTRPVRTNARLMPRLVAVAGTFILTAIAVSPSDAAISARTILAALLLLLGNAVAALSLWTLGRSFSVMPEARRLITSGPYAWVRHPIYLGEILAGCGIALQSTSPAALPILCAFIALQVQRARYEEHVLQQAFPEYQQYRARTARLIPLIF
jgi:protein-S-isoprenylcysteine O-methyltransferase Ste14